MRHRLVARGRWLLRRLQRVLPEGRPGIVILAYHLIGAGTRSPVDLAEEAFRRQMEEVAHGGKAISLSEALAAVERREPVVENRVVVTFDDAYENFDRHARQILENLRIPATMFVPTDFIDGRRNGPLTGSEKLPALTWERLATLAEGGLIELGSHSKSHPDLRELTESQLEDELEGSAQVIERQTGARPAAFCFPRALCPPHVERLVARSYRGAVVGGGAKNDPRVANPFRLQRVSLRRDMPEELAPLLACRVVLEEWVANRARRLIHDGRRT